MPQSLGYVALLVHNYDEALAYFREKLGFHVVEDSPSKDRNSQPSAGC
jgi:catechol 2,3-dioxygenase-like lactoylglutathione lyase family enzyme